MVSKIKPKHNLGILVNIGRFIFFQKD